MWERYYPQITVDYSLTGKGSVDGDPDQAVLNMLEDLRGRKVLEVAAGDGRYTRSLLMNGNRVFAGDYGLEPLLAFRNKVPVDLRAKYHPFRMDAFSPPIRNGAFDVVVCTGFLYLFPEETLLIPFAEFVRVMRPSGILIVDFATGIKRQRLDGSLVQTEVSYTLVQGLETTARLLTPNFRFVRQSLSEINQDLTGPGQPGYIMINRKLNIMAERI